MPAWICVAPPGMIVVLLFEEEDVALLREMREVLLRVGSSTDLGKFCSARLGGRTALETPRLGGAIYWCGYSGYLYAGGVRGRIEVVRGWMACEGRVEVVVEREESERAEIESR